MTGLSSAISTLSESNTEMRLIIILEENVMLFNLKAVLLGYSLSDSLGLEFLQKSSTNVL